MWERVVAIFPWHVVAATKLRVPVAYIYTHYAASRSSLLVSLTLSLLPLAGAEGTFITPSGPDGKNFYQVGSRVDVEWTGAADYSQLSLGYYSSSNVTVKSPISDSLNYPTSYTWTPRPATDGFSKWGEDQFYLYIVNGSDFGLPFESPAFSIRKQATTTLASSTSAPTASPTVSPTVSPTASPTATKQAGTPDHPANSDAGGLSSGAKAGIGAGVGGGALLILGLVAFFLLRRRKTTGAAGEYEKPPYQEPGHAAHHAGKRGDEKILGTPTANLAEAPSTTRDGGRPTAELDTQPGERFELA
ncbi:uncharacterized protein PG986_001314 [Apiospora aurea]|uniref:Uncharacterized protein n=1 Tax=Apiospora aurea TaxID=335848 RepID=A0ABR1QX53_9PEZI